MSVSRAPATGWYLEVDLTAEDTRRLRPAGEPTWSPTINDLPTIEIPVRAADDIWTRGRADGATVRVYKDGVKLPFEQVSEVNRRRGNGRSEVLLTCVGGVDLNKRVQRVYQNKPVPDAVRDLISSETNLVENVDDPKAGFGGGTTTLLPTSTASEFRNNLTPLTASDFTADTPPLVVDDTNDEIRRQQTSWLWAAGNATDATAGDGLSPISPASTVTGVSGASHGTVIRWDDANANGGAEDSNTLPLAYDIPGGAVRVAIRVRATGSGTDLSIQGYDGRGTPPSDAEIPLSTLPDNSFVWVVRSLNTDSTDFVSGDDLSVSASSVTPDGINPSYQIDVDAMAIWDGRLNHEGGELDGNDNLTGPRPYGTVSDAVRFETSEPQLSTATLDGARTVLTVNNTDNVEAAATMAGTTHRARDSIATVEPGELADRASGGAGLAGFGSQNASPAEGVSQHILSGFELVGLTTGERRLIGQSFDDDLLNVLQTIAEESGSIWAVESAPAGGLSLEWSRPGSRDPQGSLSPAAVDLDRIVQRVEAATVRGGRRRRAEEIVAPDPTSGTPASVAAVGGETVGEAILGARPGDSATSVGLSFGNLIPGTERVVRVSDDTEFDPIQDYRLDYLRGEFRLVQTGSISPGDTLEITYQHKPTGRFEAGQFDGDPRADQTFDIGRATTPSACQQAAQRIVRQTPAARIEARVDVSDLDPTTSVIRSLGVAELDIPQEFDIQGFDNAPGDSVIRLGTARPVEEIVASVARDIGDVSQRI